MWWSSWNRYTSFRRAFQGYIDIKKNYTDETLFRIVKVVYDESQSPGVFKVPLDIKQLLREKKLKRIIQNYDI